MVDEERYDIDAKVAKNDKEVPVYVYSFDLYVDLVLLSLYVCVQCFLMITNEDLAAL